MVAATQFYVSGPCYTWVGLGSSNAFEFLGYTESGMTVEIVSLQEDIQVDYAGAMPGTVAQLGQEANISATFTRYYEPVSLQVQSFLGPNGVPGVAPNGSVGSLMYEEGLSYPLLLWSPYNFKSNYGTMIPGFLFYNTYLSNPHRSVLSVRRKAPEFQWRSIPVFGTFISSTFNANTAPFNAYELYEVLPQNYSLPLIY